MRVWRKKTGPPSSSQIANAASSSIGAASTNMIEAARKSKPRLTMKLSPSMFEPRSVSNGTTPIMSTLSPAGGALKTHGTSHHRTAILFAHLDDVLVLRARRIGQRDRNFEARMEPGQFGQARETLQHRQAAILPALAATHR